MGRGAEVSLAIGLGSMLFLIEWGLNLRPWDYYVGALLTEQSSPNIGSLPILSIIFVRGEVVFTVRSLSTL